MIDRLIRQAVKWTGIGAKQRAISDARSAANRWLENQCATIEGHVLSIGSGTDSDGQGGCYREYFRRSVSYTTSDTGVGFEVDMLLDARSMTGIDDATYDCVFCSGVLEHVDDYKKALSEITRILKPQGTLLLGLPFRQAIHLAPFDFWRFTIHGIKYLLAESYEIVDVAEIDVLEPGFPSAYWVRATKRA